MLLFFSDSVREEMTQLCGHFWGHEGFALKLLLVLLPHLHWNNRCEWRQCNTLYRFYYRETRNSFECLHKKNCITSNTIPVMVDLQFSEKLILEPLVKVHIVKQFISCQSHRIVNCKGKKKTLSEITWFTIGPETLCLLYGRQKNLQSHLWERCTCSF